MNYIDNYIYNKKLQGYEVIGVSNKKVENFIEAKNRYEKFKDGLDLRPIQEYFVRGLEAKVFRKNGKILKKNDDLYWGINIGGYQYTFRRQPLRSPNMCNNNAILLEQLKAQGLI